MCAVNDAHHEECHSDPLKVGIANEVADSKIAFRYRVVRSGRSIHHSNGLDEPRNFPPRRNSPSSSLRKRRPKVSGKSIFLKTGIGNARNDSDQKKEREILHKKSVFQKK